MTEFLVEFELDIPESVPNSDADYREAGVAALGNHMQAVNLWRTFLRTGPVTILGLYSADSDAELNELLGGLPLFEWMHASISPLLQHPDAPGGTRARPQMSRFQRPGTWRRTVTRRRSE